MLAFSVSPNEELTKGEHFSEVRLLENQIEALLAADRLLDGRLALFSQVVVAEVELCKQQTRAQRLIE